MDILKILSRGIKNPNRFSAEQANSAVPKLPSAGTQTHPQLFNDAVPGRSKKRKRKRENDDSKVANPPELPDVDFFAPKTEEISKSQADGDSDPEEEPEPVDQNTIEPAKPFPKLDADECRSLLRSHRLKIASITTAETTIRRKKKSKKSTNTTKTEVIPKGQHTPLFPRPLQSFRELRRHYSVSTILTENLEKQGFKMPTEVQMGSLPLLLDPPRASDDEEETTADEDEQPSSDFMAVAPTGSGKTISFLIPAINRIVRRRERGKLRDIHELEAIVIAPTRELAFQIVNEARKLVLGTNLKVVLMRKGLRVSVEKAQDVSPNQDQGEADIDVAAEDDESEGGDDDDHESKNTRTTVGADILVTTPMPLLNFLKQEETGGRKSILPTVQTLVLDEADVLLDPLFLDQTMGIWTACTSPLLRVTFWSATMASNIETLILDKIESRANQVGVDPKPLLRLVVGLKDTAVPNVTHKLVYTGSETGKLLAIRQLLRPASRDDSGPPLRPPFIVFTQTIERAAALQEELKYDIPLEAGGATRIASLHSDLSDHVRAGIMRRFRAGEIWVLITTDVLSRGVDFAGVNGVVNYDVPGSSAVYVHRAGRTGRAGREGGIAVTLYTKDDIPFIKTVANVIAASDRQAGKSSDQAGVQKWLLDALPKVSKEDKKRLRRRGVEARRSGGAGAQITTKSGWDRQRENNRRAAIVSSKKRNARGEHDDDSDEGRDSEWGGIAD